MQDKVSVSLFSLVPGIVITGIILFFALVQADFNFALPAAGVLLVSSIAGLWVRAASAYIRFEMKPDRERLFPGETLELALEIENNKFLPVWVNLELPSPIHLETPGAAEEKTLKSGLRLLSWEKSRRIWNLLAKQRGVSSLGPARISAGDLLGLGSREKTFAFPREIIVFPRRLNMLPLHIPFQEFFGTHAARGPVEDPAWYAGTREYSGTRPAKDIHWKASARLGVLQEKLYEPTYRRKVLFVFDAESYIADEAGENQEPSEPGTVNSEAMVLRDFERMLETLGTLAAALMETGASFGLVSGALLAGLQQSGAAVLPAGRGPEHLGSLLEMLARAKTPDDADYKTPPQSSRLNAVLREASQAYTGLIYCGASPLKAAQSAVLEAGKRKKILFVFSNNAEDSFMDKPACLARDICSGKEEEK